MITTDYCQMMARYNAWQSRGQMEVFQSMPSAELRKDRKSFFGSIFATANHLLWGDQLWMARFDGGFGPSGGVKDSVNMHENLQLFLDDRMRMDARITRWAAGLRQLDLVGPLTYRSVVAEREFSKPMEMCVTHFFNHQTHHRGQIHAMLSQAGQSIGDTDLVFMGEED
ncbi:MAG: DinB family protein [Litoreibacter sp.]|uniref:DinB family protein n=1 Tax=Litoreibacter sp. TaxID=1969459 RepID=UPI003297A6B8